MTGPREERADLPRERYADKTGFNREAIRHVRTPNGSTACSLRLSERIRAIAYRDREFLRLVSLHPEPPAGARSRM